jgi:hypothetical protein
MLETVSFEGKINNLIYFLNGKYGGKLKRKWKVDREARRYERNYFSLNFSALFVYLYTSIILSMFAFFNKYIRMSQPSCLAFFSI